MQDWSAGIPLEKATRAELLQLIETVPKHHFVPGLRQDLERELRDVRAVSYTHLTLPTKRIV